MHLSKQTSSATVRIRFAPSPTGALHIGGVRTALFGYILAKQNNGTFILRLEDTDQNRFVEGAEAHIFASLEWCGISIDESSQKPGNYGPYRQSERKDIYKKYIHLLLEKGFAYYAFDSKEELDNLRLAAEQKGEAFMYNSANRLSLKNALSLEKSETERLIASGEYVVRFKTTENTIVCQDAMRGQVSFEGRLIEDKILFKSDDMPTYHLANVVDDHLMEITHVIRGEEWLPSLPLHVCLYEAFGWPMPIFMHLPLILKPDGKGKLSKRATDQLGIPIYAVGWKDGDNYIPGFKEKGYLPQALVNFLALLGWNPGNNQEILSIDDLIKLFDPSKINLSGAKFDIEKLNWFNHHYIQNTEVEYLAVVFQKDLHKRGIDKPLRDLKTIVSLIKDRSSTLSDFWNLSSYLFEKPKAYNENAKAKVWKSDSKDILTLVSKVIEMSEPKAEVLEQAIKDFALSQNIPLGHIMSPLRLALVGDLVGINVFWIIAILGKPEALERIKNLGREA